MLLSRDLTLRTTGNEEITLMGTCEVLSLNPDSIITTYAILGK